MKFLITGGAGFIGSALVRYLIGQTAHEVVNVDKLTYAGHLVSVAAVSGSPRYRFIQADVADGMLMHSILQDTQPDIIIHLAAESHVDRSIHGSAVFIESNIVGTYQLLEAARAYWQGLDKKRQAVFRLHYVSTDEVYGDIALDCPAFKEGAAYAPSSPYAASKAAAEHLVGAWGRTYGLPIVISHCTNNYGPYHLPEKLIPLMILRAIKGQSLPLYGDGSQRRDWLYVDDHVRALFQVATRGQIGAHYHISGGNEYSNREVVEMICMLLEALRPDKPVGVVAYRDLMVSVADRAGHDQRYALNAEKIRQELAWQPEMDFMTGLRLTIQWYLEHLDWVDTVMAAQTLDGARS